MKYGRIALVDISTVLHKVRLSKKNLSYGKEIADTILMLRRKLKADRIIFIQDYGKSRYRKDIFPEYKEHRLKNLEEQTQEEKEKYELMGEWNKNLHLFSPLFEAYKIYGVEADDICSMLYWDLTQLGYEVIIASKDKDFLSALPFNALYNVTKERFYNEEDRKGLTRQQFKLYQTMFGDSADNIPSFAGEKTAIILAKNFSTFKAMREFNGDVMGIVGVTPHTRRYVEKALEVFKDKNILDKLKLNYDLISIFTDTSKLNETELKQYVDILEKIQQDIDIDNLKFSEELEEFLEKVGEYETILYMEELLG